MFSRNVGGRRHRRALHNPRKLLRLLQLPRLQPSINVSKALPVHTRMRPPSDCVLSGSFDATKYIDPKTWEMKVFKLSGENCNFKEFATTHQRSVLLKINPTTMNRSVFTLNEWITLQRFYHQRRMISTHVSWTKIRGGLVLQER